MTPKKLYRVVAISRVITWTLLFAGLIMRATTGFAPVVTIGGSIHGLVSSRPKRHGGAHRRQPRSTFLTGQLGFLAVSRRCWGVQARSWPIRGRYVRIGRPATFTVDAPPPPNTTPRAWPSSSDIGTSRAPAQFFLTQR